LSKTKIVFGILITLSLHSSIIQAEKTTEYIYTLSYTFENQGTIEYELTQEDVSIPLFMNTSYHTIILENVDQEYTAKVLDIDGNHGAIVGINRLLLPGQEISFTATYSISSREQERTNLGLDEAQGSDTIPKSLIDEFTKSTETFPADDPRFSDLASRIVAGEESVLSSVAVLVDYIITNTTYCNFDVPQYPNDTLDSQLGDCDDQSILLITLCRSIDIPAYLQVGIYIHPAIDDKDTSWDGHLISEADGVGWHGWAMIYVPPWGWIPIDLTLIDSESGLDMIRNAPEYGVNIIPALTVSNQSYIGDTIATRTRITNSTLYVTVKDEAKEVFGSDEQIQNYILLGLGAALLIAIGLMFYSTNRQ
jgi:hypothetical protein